VHLSRAAIAAVLSPAAPIDRSSPSSSGAHVCLGAIISSPSARALQDDVYSRWPFVCLRPRRSVSNSRRSKLCPFLSRITSKVARHPQASMLGLASLPLQPSVCRSQVSAFKTCYPHAKSPDFLKRGVTVLARWKLARGLQQLRRHLCQFFQSRCRHFFAFSPSVARRDNR
jgi:hypothetical protein